MRRVAVTGAGVVSPLGTTLHEFHESLIFFDLGLV